jgi:RNA polymerase sigma-70 factor (ECF subfamily)
VAVGAGAAATERASDFRALCTDDLAFTDWYRAALPRVYGYVYARTGTDAELAEDITALAFLEAIRSRASFDGRSDPVTWICAIARNRLVDHYRAAARERGRHLRLVVGDLTDVSQTPFDRLDDRDRVLGALAALPAMERSALTLRYLDGYSVRDTAQLIGRSESATESLLVRARERVRGMLHGGLR